MELKKLQLVSIFLINFEQYKTYVVVQVSYPEKSRICRLEDKFPANILGLTLASNCCD